MSDYANDRADKHINMMQSQRQQEAPRPYRAQERSLRERVPQAKCNLSDRTPIEQGENNERQTD